MPRSAIARIAFVLRVLLRRHRRTIRLWSVVLWVSAAVLALLMSAALLVGELVLYGFRDRPPPG